MESSLFEAGCPVLVVLCVARNLRPCPSYSRRGDRIHLGLWRSLYKRGGRGTCQCPPPAGKKNLGLGHWQGGGVAIGKGVGGWYVAIASWGPLPFHILCNNQVLGSPPILHTLLPSHLLGNIGPSCGDDVTHLKYSQNGH